MLGSFGDADLYFYHYRYVKREINGGEWINFFYLRLNLSKQVSLISNPLTNAD